MWNKLWKWLGSGEVAAFISKYDFTIKVYVLMFAFVFGFLIHQFFVIDCVHLGMWLFIVTFFGPIYGIIYLVDPDVEYMKDPLSRDIPSVDNSLFILARKLLISQISN